MFGASCHKHLPWPLSQILNHLQFLQGIDWFLSGFLVFELKSPWSLPIQQQWPDFSIGVQPSKPSVKGFTHLISSVPLDSLSSTFSVTSLSFQESWEIWLSG